METETTFVRRRAAAHAAETAGIETDPIILAVFGHICDPPPLASPVEPGAMLRPQAE